MSGLRYAVLWDLDGTLVDSAEYHWRAWQETMRAAGIEITREQFQETFGQRNDAFLPKWLGSGDPERVQRVADEKEARYRELISGNGLAPLPGAAEWTARLRQSGWLQAVASSAPRLNVDAMLRSLGMAFDATVAAEEVTHGKPDPEVFLKAAEKVGADPKRCIVVEDAQVGVEAARRAGMKSIGVGSGAARLGADLARRSLAELPADAFEQLLK